MGRPTSLPRTGRDNGAYAQPCYCDRRLTQFRRWLTARNPEPRQRFGLPGFAHVRLPRYSEEAPVNDPLYQEWIRFRCDQLSAARGQLRDCVKSLAPDAVVLANPAFPRQAAWANRLSFDPVSYGRHTDLVFADNGNFPRKEDEFIVSQVRACKVARACGYRVVSTAWEQNAAGPTVPDTPDKSALSVLESAAFGAVPGNIWALRPIGGGAGMGVDALLKAE
ncbi:MAG: hypothetical protein GW911_35275, partial [Armatimonadetes bacterium]|nr:hypothetical protein [Armatimonadota bacterium]